MSTVLLPRSSTGGTREMTRWCQSLRRSWPRRKWTAKSTSRLKKDKANNIFYRSSTCCKHISEPCNGECTEGSSKHWLCKEQCIDIYTPCDGSCYGDRILCKKTNRCLSLAEKEQYEIFISCDGKLIKHLMIWNKRNRTHLMVLGTSQYPSIYNFVPYLFSHGSNLITTNVCPSVSFSVIKW